MALNESTTGDENLALGRGALTNSTAANDNVAVGLHALFADTGGHDNTGLGHAALNSNTNGNRNIAIGSGAGGNLTTGDDNVDIANAGQVGEAGTIRIGTQGVQTQAFLQGVSGTSLSGHVQRVLINANGQLGTARGGPTKPGGAGASVDDRLLSRLQAKVRRLAQENRRQERELRKLRARR